MAASVRGAVAEFDSEGFSFEELLLIAGCSSTTAPGVDTENGVFSLESCVGRNWARVVGGSLSTMIFFCRFVLSTRPLVSGGEATVAVEVDMVMRRDWRCGAEGEDEGEGEGEVEVSGVGWLTGCVAFGALMTLLRDENRLMPYCCVSLRRWGIRMGGR